MNMIAAVDANWSIGNNGNLLFHLPTDMKFFKDMTQGKIVIMGRKTLESLPNKQPLKNRKTYILTKNKEYTIDNAIICHSIYDLFNKLKDKNDDNIFVCGGGHIYEQLLPFCDTFYITHILDDKSESDTKFPNLSSMDDIKLVRKSGTITENGVKYYFAKYERI